MSVEYTEGDNRNKRQSEPSASNTINSRSSEHLILKFPRRGVHGSVQRRGKHSNKRFPSSGFLSQIRPDRERLFQENQELKAQINELNDVLTRYKTKVSQLEKENNRHDELFEDMKKGRSNSSLKSFHLVHNLKQTIKSLREELQQKESENIQLRRNIKSTSRAEMETEFQAYIDECTRLKHHLEEALKRNDEESRNFPSDSDQREMMMLKEENDEQMRTIVKLKAELWRSKNPVLQNVPKMFKKIYKLFNGRLDFLDSLVSPDITHISDFLGSISNIKLSDGMIEEFLNAIMGEISDFIDLNNFKFFYEKYVPCKYILNHISLRMQLSRLSKDQLLDCLIGKDLKAEALMRNLKREPFVFNDEEIENFVYDLLEMGDIEAVSRFVVDHTDKWNIYTDVDEEEFDKNLRSVISEHQNKLLRKCDEFDCDRTGFITYEQFDESLQNSGIEIPYPLRQYVCLLLYSHSNSLDAVPYKSFIDAYGESQYENNEMREYLNLIAQTLINTEKTVRDVFQADTDGCLNLNQLEDGLNYLDIFENQETVHFITDSLMQKKQVIYISDLEEIFCHYGVPAHNEGTSEEDYNSDHTINSSFLQNGFVSDNPGSDQEI